MSERPTLRVVSGSPTPEELAALTAVVAVASAAVPPALDRVRRGGWNDPAWQHRRPLRPGPNAWRAMTIS
jgi:hypothetical protein